MHLRLESLSPVLEKVWAFNHEHRKTLYSIEMTVGRKQLEMYLFESDKAILKAKWPNNRTPIETFTRQFFTQLDETLQKDKHGGARSNTSPLPPLI